MLWLFLHKVFVKKVLALLSLHILKQKLSRSKFLVSLWTVFPPFLFRAVFESQPQQASLVFKVHSSHSFFELKEKRFGCRCLLAGAP